jgi:hypothetical protein
VGDRTGRQLRARLARRRPAPGRLRRRAQGERVVSGPRGVSWVHLGTVVGAMAAIGSVVFTRVATYYSALVAGDQLQQSREYAERGQRQQAELVSYWVEPLVKGVGWRVHVVNRSADPVYDVGLGFSVGTAQLGPDVDEVVYMHWRGDMGPCSELLYEQSATDVFSAPPGLPRPLVGRPEIDWLMFTDRAGKQWLREPNSLSPRRAAADPPARPPIKVRGSITSEPKSRAIDYCGGSPS